MTNDARGDRPALLAHGLIRPSILVHLVGGESVYGYELHHRLRTVGLECDQGTVYRALNTMEDEGLLRSTWERTAGGRSRRRYELTEAGADVVDSYVTPVAQVMSVAQAFLDMRKRISGGPRPVEQPSTQTVEASDVRSHESILAGAPSAR